MYIMHLISRPRWGRRHPRHTPLQYQTPYSLRYINENWPCHNNEQTGRWRNGVSHPQNSLDFTRLAKLTLYIERIGFQTEYDWRVSRRLLVQVQRASLLFWPFGGGQCAPSLRGHPQAFEYCAKEGIAGDVRPRANGYDINLEAG